MSLSRGFLFAAKLECLIALNISFWPNSAPMHGFKSFVDRIVLLGTFFTGNGLPIGTDDVESATTTIVEDGGEDVAVIYQ